MKANGDNNNDKTLFIYLFGEYDLIRNERFNNG
jgi:hypothetical protein